MKQKKSNGFKGLKVRTSAHDRILAIAKRDLRKICDVVDLILDAYDNQQASKVGAKGA